MAVILKECGYTDATNLLTQCRDFKCLPDVDQCCCRRLLYNQPNFVSVKTILEEHCQRWGFLVEILPKYHCELNPLEMVWGRSNFIIGLILHWKRMKISIKMLSDHFVRGHSGSPYTTSALLTSLPMIFQPTDHFHSLLNWKHCGRPSATLPTISLFVSVVIFIMTWFHHTICYHISHHTILHFNYYFIVRF
jgi:hypothetical protein